MIDDQKSRLAEKKALEDDILMKEKMINYLTTENQRLKSEIEIYEYSKTLSTLKIAESEKARQEVLKELQKTKDELKFELKARDGLVTKSNTFEFENINLRDEKKTLLAAQSMSLHRIKELENALNDERVKRLRDMHEIDVLRRENQQLSRRCSNAEEDAHDANVNLIEKLERTDLVLTQNQSQKRVLLAQSEELGSLTTEVTLLKEDRQRLHTEISRLCEELTKRNDKCISLEEEIHRLRRELIVSAPTQTGKSKAFHPTASQIRSPPLGDTQSRSLIQSRESNSRLIAYDFPNESSLLSGQSAKTTGSPVTPIKLSSSLSMAYMKQSREQQSRAATGLVEAHKRGSPKHIL